MAVKILIMLSLITAVIGKNSRNKGNNRGSEEEDRTEMLYRRMPTTTLHSTVAINDAVVEKFVETLISSERYLKMIETVERKLTHLDANFRDKYNAILKYLAEILRLLKISPTELLEKSLLELKTDLDRLKEHMGGKLETHQLRMEKNVLPHDRQPGLSAKPSENDYRIDPSIDNRLSNVESNMKTIMSGVDSIVNIISEVKNRQYSNRGYAKSERTESGVPPMDTMTILSEFRRTLQEQRLKKNECTYKGRVERSERYPTDCFEIQMQGFNVSGIYKIRPDDMEPFYVLCDLNSAGGGWTVFQNRYDGSQDFYKNWADYKYGFGNLAGEFWLGLDKIHFLTNQKLYEMRVEVETQHGLEGYAGFSVFTIGPEHEGYRISTLGTYYGTAGDSLTYHAGQKFSTPDIDNDEWKDGSCATEHGGAWWYKECDKSNLNGKYTTTSEENRGQTIYWISFKGPTFPLTKTKMMIRPLPASKPVDYIDNNRKPAGGRIRPGAGDKKGPRKNDVKAPYDVALGHNQPQYRYEDAVNADAFFPSYT